MRSRTPSAINLLWLEGRIGEFPDEAYVIHIAKKRVAVKLPSGLHAASTQVLAVEEPLYGPIVCGEVLRRHDQLLVRALCRD